MTYFQTSSIYIYLFQKNDVVMLKNNSMFKINLHIVGKLSTQVSEFKLHDFNQAVAV